MGGVRDTEQMEKVEIHRYTTAGSTQHPYVILL